MPERFTDEDLDLLGELGVDAAPTQSVGRSAAEQRVIAGFEEVERFVQEHGRAPQHGEDRDIFERLYAVRLDRIRASADYRKILEGLDPKRLLVILEETDSCRVMEESSDEELLAALGVDLEDSSDITKLTHVRPREEIHAAEEVARRTPCREFPLFAPLFERVQQDLRDGRRKTLPFQDNAEVDQGDLFILDGQKVYVATKREPFVSDYGRPDQRLRVIYDNGTESDLLLRSLQRGLNKDKTSRRITEPSLGPLFTDEESDDDLPTGSIYVLRSKSDHPFIAENRTVIHKIGVTGGDVKKRIANAKKDPTYLLADVEIVGRFKLSNINRTRLEALIQKFFGAARLDLQLKDRFGDEVEPREWFLLPLNVIEDAIAKIIDGSIADFRYDPNAAQIVRHS